MAGPETKAFLKEDLEELSYTEAGDSYKGMRMLEVSPWDDQGKYQYQSKVFEFDGKLWRVKCQRHGSYFSEYYYDWDDLSEIVATRVYPHEVVIKKTVYKTEPPNDKGTET